MPTKTNFPPVTAAKMPIWTHGCIPVHSKTREKPFGNSKAVFNASANDCALSNAASIFSTGDSRGRRCVFNLYFPPPNSAAIASRLTSISAITISATPITERAIAVSMPIAPAPKMNALDPGNGSQIPLPPLTDLLMAWSDTASGSTRAPCSNVTDSGRRWHIAAG